MNPQWVHRLQRFQFARLIVSLSVFLYVGTAAAVECFGTSVPDGFDFPLSTGEPLTKENDGDGYYVATDFNERIYDGRFHLGEDWNGEGGGNSDFGDPVIAAANGNIVYAENAGPGWGNVIILEHVLPNGTKVQSLYGHLNEILCTSGSVTRGQQIGTIGRGYYYGKFPNGEDHYDWTAHLHFEIRSDSSLGVGRGYEFVDTGYENPSQFILSNRQFEPPGFDTVEGHWLGKVTDLRGGYEFITLTLFSDENEEGHIGQFDYPLNDCGGYLTFLEEPAGTTFVVQENHTYGSCINRARVVLTYDPEPATMTWEFYTSSTRKIGEATLTRGSSGDFADLQDTWTGTGYQYDSQTSWTLEMTLTRFGDVSEPVGTIDYPSLECGGTLSRAEEIENTFVLRETITYGVGECVDGGAIYLTLGKDANTLNYYWIQDRGRRGLAEATLDRN